MTSKTYEQKLNNFSQNQLIKYIRSYDFVEGRHRYPPFPDIFQEFILKQPTPILEVYVARMLDFLNPHSQYYIKNSNFIYAPLIDFLQKTIKYNQLTEKLEDVPINQPLRKACKI